MRTLSICGPAVSSPNTEQIICRRSFSNPQVARPQHIPMHEDINALQSACLRTASWLGFVIGLCCGMSITAVLAISILGN